MKTLLPYEYTDKIVTPWGGMRLIKEFWEHTGFHQKLASLPFREPGSGNGQIHWEIMESFLVSVILGAGNSAGASSLRHDDAIKEIFQWNKGMPSQSSLSRFFGKYDYTETSALYQEIQSWILAQQSNKYFTLDIDSTVTTRYGNQEGAEVGYNPKKPGRKSHHPLMAFLAEARMVANAWVRPGDMTSAACFDSFLNSTLEIIPASRIGLIRGDSGFSGNEVLNHIEKLGIHYIIALPLKAGVVNQILNVKSWSRTSTKGVTCCSFMYESKSWGKQRRVVVVRKDTKDLPNCGGRTLFREQDDYLRYKYSAYVTDSKLSDELVWHTYKHRAEAENQIKELKYDYALEGFSFQTMDAIEFAFQWITVAYNMMSYYRNSIEVGEVKPTLSTLKFNCIAVGAYLTTSGRQKKLMVAARNKKREILDDRFQRLTAFQLAKFNSTA